MSKVLIIGAGGVGQVVEYRFEQQTHGCRSGPVGNHQQDPASFVAIFGQSFEDDTFDFGGREFAVGRDGLG